MNYYDPNTKLLLHCDGNILDSSKSAHILTDISTSSSTSIYKFGNASRYFNSSAYLSTPASSDFVFGSGDFTIDLWIYPSAVGQSNNTEIIVKHADATALAGYAIDMSSGTYNLRFKASSNGSSWDITSGTVIGTLTQDIWTHIAVVRSGNTFYLFKDGVLANTLTSSAALYDSGSSPLLIGGGNYTSTYFQGAMDELRISKGVARWTSDFTPPTAPYRG